MLTFGGFQRVVSVNPRRLPLLEMKSPTRPAHRIVLCCVHTTSTSLPFGSITTAAPVVVVVCHGWWCGGGCTTCVVWVAGGIHFFLSLFRLSCRCFYEPFDCFMTCFSLAQLFTHFRLPGSLFWYARYTCCYRLLSSGVWSTYVYVPTCGRKQLRWVEKLFILDIRRQMPHMYIRRGYLM